jgi:hypothetical protein
MHDDSYLPQRVWLECAGAVSDPTKATNTWYQGFNGDDAKDYFDDTTTPNAHDNSGAATGITIRPMSTAPGATMQVEITIAPVGSVPQVSWVQPAADATVSGTTHVEVASNAASRVEYYVNGCLKNVESGPAPYTGFDWNTPSCLDGAQGGGVQLKRGDGQGVRRAARHRGEWADDRPVAAIQRELQCVQRSD